MADPIGEYKVRELDPYTILDTSDANYIAPSDIVVLVDSASNKWGTPLPRTIPLETLVSFGAGVLLSGDKGIIENPTTRDVTITFNSNYNRVPVGRSDLYVYRIVDEGGVNYDQQVKITDLVISSVQCTFNIADDEELTGVIIEYNFM